MSFLRTDGGIHSKRHLMNFFNKVKPIFLFLFLIILPFICHALDIDIVNARPSLYTKLKEMGLDDAEIKEIFSDKRIALYPEILERRGKGINYLSPKFGLLSKKSIKRGKKILEENVSILNKINSVYNVDKEVLVAIYRLETNFGSYLGNYSVFNALLTLTLMDNRRSEWAEDELVNFIALSRLHKKDIFSIKGSWAGAFGICQFVPTSFLQYAVDGDNNGIIDLFNFHDAMASMANYLKNHGWERGNMEKMKKAVWHYNHCDNYVKAVFLYSRAIKR